MTTDGAAAMQSSQKGVIKKIQERPPNCVGIHRILHREALVTKKLKLNADKAGDKQNELNNVLREVVQIVNAIRKSAKQQRLFSKLSREMFSSSKKLIFCIQRFDGYLVKKFFPVCLKFEKN